MLPHLPEVDTPKREPVRQAVFGGGPLCQRHSRRLNVDPGDGQFRLPLQEQQPQQAGAAAQIADPQSGGELRQGGQQKGVRAGAEQRIIPDEPQPVRFQVFPMLHAVTSR